MKLLFAILMLSASAYGQALGNVTMALFNGTPTGSCSSRQIALNTTNGALYTCSAGAWVPIGAGGGGWNPPPAPGSTLFGNNSVATGAPSFFQATGDISFGGGTFSVNQLHFGPNPFALTNTGMSNGNCLQVSGTDSIIGGPCGTGGGGGTGTVTSFSAGTLSPLFTTSVATATTTPALSFTLSNAPAGTMLGNSTSAAAPPQWITIPAGGGGTGSLNGCATPTVGNLVCDNSVVGGTGPIGMLSLPYTGTGLPTPPAAGLGALAINSSGVYWTPGNNTAFAQLGAGGGGGTGNATGLTFGSTTIALGTTAPTSGQYLYYNGTSIVGNTPAGGGGAMGGVTIVQ